MKLDEIDKRILRALRFGDWIHATRRFQVHGEAEDVRFLVQLASGTGPEAAAATVRSFSRVFCARMEET